MRMGVVGHVEWVEFLAVDGPPRSGGILHGQEAWSEAAGGGAVAAVDMARMEGACTLLTALGDDAIGRGIPDALELHGVDVVASTVPGAHRRAVTLIEPSGERTIVVVGEAQARWGLLPSAVEGMDGVYFCKGNAESVRSARSARVLVGTARCLPVLQQAGVRLDALVMSNSDPAEAYGPGDLDPVPALVAVTEGAAGGRWFTDDGREGRWAAAPVPGREEDAYGCGDSFAAGLTVALARGMDADAATAFAATRGALALARRGAHGGPQGGSA